MSRRALGRGALGVASVGFAATGAGAQDAWPGNRPVSIVVSFAPGGSTDIIARILAQQLSRELNANFVVENRPGASGTIGMASVARSRPDGHTLVFSGGGTYSMVGHLYPRRGYDEETSFDPVGSVTTSSIFLCVNPNIGVRDIQGFIAKAKAEPGKMSYGSSGAGGSAHVATELFLGDAGIEVESITYRGGAPALQALISGEVQMAFVEAVSALPAMRQGSILGIGVSSAERSPLAPDVPAIGEVLHGYECTTVTALFAPAGTPEPIIRRLYAGIVVAMQVPEVVAQLRTGAVFPRVMSPEEFRPYLAAERKKWGEVIRARNIRV
ncbi:tripartite tricarboxylate transporter substrate binding protein [Roseomonas sp. AR75]|uniref:Bug family tripartite tricarboxylate transporter substrate binding protein n=1 Tax=Roseomonas sp. AR75 TaxID=2562311 RepID=UPI0010BFCAE9|nr:tripartite tricarboxylate transporter substrate-binding protein [Roseomonas sp. AR75]